MSTRPRELGPRRRRRRRRRYVHCKHRVGVELGADEGDADVDHVAREDGGLGHGCVENGTWMIWGGRCGLTKTKQKSPTTLVSRPVGVGVGGTWLVCKNGGPKWYVGTDLC